MIFIIILAVLFLILLTWAISVFNRVNRANLKCDEALSGIDVALAKRHDVLTKSLAAVNKYVDYEKTTILESIKIRQGSPIAQKMADNQKMDEIQNYLFGLAENYPDLKASTNFVALQQSIDDTEEHLQAARRAYNANATKFNEFKVTFPDSIIASKIGPNRRDYFEASEEQKQDVEIK